MQPNADSAQCCSGFEMEKKEKANSYGCAEGLLLPGGIFVHVNINLLKTLELFSKWKRHLLRHDSMHREPEKHPSILLPSCTQVCFNSSYASACVYWNLNLGLHLKQQWVVLVGAPYLNFLFECFGPTVGSPRLCALGKVMSFYRMRITITASLCVHK